MTDICLCEVIFLNTLPFSQLPSSSPTSLLPNTHTAQRFPGQNMLTFYFRCSCADPKTPDVSAGTSRGKPPMIVETKWCQKQEVPLTFSFSFQGGVAASSSAMKQCNIAWVCQRWFWGSEVHSRLGDTLEGGLDDSVQTMPCLEKSGSLPSRVW